MRLPPGVRRLFPQKIWQQIFLVLFFLVVFPLVLLGFLLLQTSQRAIQAAILHNHQQIAIQASGKIKEHIDGSWNVLAVTASILGAMPADPWQHETAMVELSLKNPAFKRIASLNQAGKEVAASELGTELRDRSQEPAFLQARKGQSYLSEVRISEDHVPFVIMAVPIKKSDRVHGVLVAHLSLRSIWNVIDEIQIGKTGQAYLVDENGIIMAHQDKKMVLQHASFRHASIIQDIRSGRAGNRLGTGQNKEAWLISYAPLKELRGGLILAQPQKEALAFSKQMNFRSVVLIVLSIPAALLISFIIARYISRPIRDMIDGTQRMAKGDYSHTFKVQGRGEMDRLLFSFNRMSQKLKKAKEAEKLSVIGMAATAIAHDLKNSLQLVNAFVQLLPQRYQDKEFIKEFSETIPKELDSWNASLKNIMSYSRNCEFPVDQLDLNELIKNIMLLVSLKAQQAHIHVDVALEERIPPVMGNEERLKQAFLNILTNALEVVPGGGRIAIATRCFPGDAESPAFAQIEIMNTGEGIKKEDLDKIFEPFYSTKTGGLGLGLSISKEIISQHKGRIHVLSEEGSPTTFVIRLPCKNALMPHAEHG